jgi:hypothetical protein
MGGLEDPGSLIVSDLADAGFVVIQPQLDST